MKWIKLINNNINVSVYYNTLPQKGKLVYEYNALRNYRVTKPMFEYNRSLYTEEELEKLFGIVPNYFTDANNDLWHIQYNADAKDKRQTKTYMSINTKRDSIEDICKKLEFKNPPYKFKVISGTDDKEFEGTSQLINHIYATKITNLNDLPEESVYKQLQHEKLLETVGFGGWTYNYKTDKPEPSITLVEPGQLTDFITDELQFSLKHPVTMLPQYSYDGSVNLILTDGLNVPKLINTRFSATGKNTYEIVDRKGDADTNIYDQGEQFEIDTNLYKSIINIPKIEFLGCNSGGNMPVGNYHFYFKLADADGNETDFCGESGLVSVFIGYEKHANTGSEHQNSFKLVRFKLSNLDKAYSYVKIYYSRSSAGNNVNAITTYAEIDKNFIINNKGICNITITGFEQTIPKTVYDINMMYNIIDSAETGTVAQNILFLGNVHKQEIPYKELTDLSLRFLPYVKEEEYNLLLDQYYDIQSQDKGYYDEKNIYSKVGYWPNEIYRLGIVYIMKNGELSPVFTIRGKDQVAPYGPLSNVYQKIPVWRFNEITKEKERVWIQEDEETHIIEVYEDGSENVVIPDLENTKGVIRITNDAKYVRDVNKIFALDIRTSDEVIQELKQYVKGYFFVRQKRIPTIVAQGVTIATDNNAHTPVMSTCGGFLGSLYDDLVQSHTEIENLNGVTHISEGFLSRYKYTIELNDRSTFKKFARIAGAIGVAVCGVAVGIFTGGIGAVAGGLAATAILGSVATAAVVTAAVGVVVGGVVVGVGGIVQGIEHFNGEHFGNSTKETRVDKSGEPNIPIHGRNIKASFANYNPKYHQVKELGDSRLLTHNFTQRVILKDDSSVKVNAIICPDFELNQPYYNSIFTGNSHLIEMTQAQSLNFMKMKKTNFFTNGDFNQPNHYYILDQINYTAPVSSRSITAKIIGVPDDTPLVMIDGIKYRSRAGAAEEVFRYECIGEDYKSEDDKNNELESQTDDTGESDTTISNKKINSEIIRGSFGPYLAMADHNNILDPAVTVNIYIPEYSEAQMEDYFNIRMNDHSSFEAISDRYSMLEIEDFLVDKNSSLQEAQSNTEFGYKWELYRGDCYLCQFTHRVNRNFNDPAAPYNHDFITTSAWKEYYDPSDSISYESINTLDLNAVKMGMWVTFRLRSSNNLNIRTLDYSYPDEAFMTSHPRGYYPYYDMETEGNFKHPESADYNNGFTKTLSDRYNLETPDVPAIKNWFGTRVMYSEIQVNDAFKNGFRVFNSTAYKDFTREYGEITKILSYQNNLFIVFEHGLGLSTIDTSGPNKNLEMGMQYLNVNNVLGDLQVISSSFGSQWKDSILQTPRGIYGVDTVAKKIWMFNGQLSLLSDFKVGEFLNNNITLSERELDPILGIKNVKTVYNAYKEDVMFTFYDNTYGLQECVWNLCYNELANLFITFYSWVPSFMANINNIPFSFDRNTSKWIAKLGQSHSENSFADGITCENVVITDKLFTTINGKDYYDLGKITVSNRIMPEGFKYRIKVEKGTYNPYRTLEYIDLIPVETKPGELEYHLCVKAECLWELKSELYFRNIKPDRNYPDWDSYKDNFSTDYPEEYFEKVNNLPIYINRNHQRLTRPRTNGYNKHNQCINPDRLVTLIPLKATIQVQLDRDLTADEAYYLYTSGEPVDKDFTQSTWADAGTYESMIGIIPEWNLQFLSTDFWKHGFAGIVDIADKIYPCYWYGKQHPFEFEVIVTDSPETHKVFQNLVIVSNKAKPESFHYEILGEAYEFSNDKLNAYFRQEALKALWQANGADICYNTDFLYLQPEQNEVSIDLPHSYVARQDTINDVEEYYVTATSSASKDYRYLSGGEITYYPTRQEFRYYNHIKGISFSDFSDDDPNSLIHSNMRYTEDRWFVNIPPLYILLKNEYKSVNYNMFHTSTWQDPNRPSLLVKNAPIPTKAFNNIQYNNGNVEIPEVLSDLGYGPADIDFSNWRDSLSIYQMGNYGEGQNLQSVPMRDRFIKIKIRYTGDELTIIDFLNTLYTLSYA